MDGVARQAEMTAQEIEEMYNRLKSVESSDASSAGDTQTADPQAAAEPLVDNYNFPFEPEGIYNSAMLDFEEISAALWTLILHTHYSATRYNRMSPNYTLLMQHLEKDIKQMGSYCITKAVLEQSGKEYPNLKMMELKELSCMVSLHFRKCCCAFNDIMKQTGSHDMNMMSWIFRWAGLFERLKATQDKIDKIKSGKINIENLLETQNVYKDEPKLRRDRSERAVEPKTRASSMSVMKSYTKEVKLQQKAEEKQERALQRAAEQAKRRLEREAGCLLSEMGVRSFAPMPLPKIPGIGLNEKELRQLLMDEAKSRMEMGEAGIIALESVEKLVERFEKLRVQRAMANGQSFGSRIKEQGASARSGSSDETRKKLREKRKKRK